MDHLRIFDTVQAYNEFNAHSSPHPLVNVLDLAKARPRHGYKMSFGIYTVILKEVACGDLMYGKNTYDYQEGTLVFIGPGQVSLVGMASSPQQFVYSQCLIPFD